MSSFFNIWASVAEMNRLLREANAQLESLGGGSALHEPPNRLNSMRTQVSCSSNSILLSMTKYGMQWGLESYV